MTKNRIIISIIVFIIIASGTAVALILINKNTHNKSPDIVIQESISKDQTKKDADKLKQDAIDAVSNNDPDKALILLEQAQIKYKEIDDQNNLVDVEALIHLYKIFQKNKTTTEDMPMTIINSI